MLTPATVSIRYPVRPSPEAWILPEGIVPEAPVHDEVAETLKLLLRVWAAKSAAKVRIARNLAIRFYEEDPRIGIDPDICVLAPPPDDLDERGSLCLWKSGHVAPSLCFEIVSTNHPNKDYVAIQDRYAALGTHELIVFDPMLAGPKSLGGPVALQLWRRDAGRAFDRLNFGNAPVYSEVLDAWVIADGRSLFIADDRAGTRRWLNEAELNRREAEENKREAEVQRQGAEQAQAAATRANAAKKQAEARARELERELEELRARTTPR